MEEHKHGLECPVCHNPITADTEADLIEKFQKHAKDEHDRDMSEQEIRNMMKMKTKM